MTDKEKRELKDGVVSIFKRFNILDHTSTIGNLRDDILRYIDSLQEEPVSEDEIEKQFKAGDVVMYISRHPAYSGLYLLGNPNDLSIGYSNADEPYQIALRNCTAASEGERRQFMRELNNNGYKWNECTLKIEKEKESGEDLEAEIKRYVYDSYFDLNGVAVKGATQYLTVEDVAEIARHFADWQKKQLFKLKEDIRDWVKEAVRQEAAKLIAKTYDDYDAKREIRDMLRSPYDSIRKDIVSAAATEICKHVKLVVDKPIKED